MTADEKLVQLGLQLPPPPRASGLYRPVIVAGQMLLTSGHPPLRTDGARITGRVGEDLSLEQAQEAAGCCGLAILSSLQAALGSLNRVQQVVRLSGMINCTPDFQQHPAVLDGCSRLFAEVFGEERGVGVRCAAGAASLPGNAPLQIEAAFLLNEVSG